MSKTRIYVVREAVGADVMVSHLVEATSAAAAIRHCALDRYSATPAKPRDVVDCMAAGVKVEVAAPEQQSIPLGEQG